LRHSDPGRFAIPSSIATGRCGEIIICDDEQEDVRVFNPEGELLQVIGPGGDSEVEWQGRLQGVCTDAEGRLFIVDGNSLVVLS
jgi:hypothetical protein